MLDLLNQKLKAFANLRVDMFRLRSINVGRMEVMSKLIQYKTEENINLEKVTDLEKVVNSMLAISIALLHETLCSYRSLVDLDSALSDEDIEVYLNQIEGKERLFELSRKIRNMTFHVRSETIDKALSEWKKLADVENQDFVTKLHELLWNYIESIFSGQRNIYGPLDDGTLLEEFEEAKRYGQELHQT